MGHAGGFACPSASSQWEDAKLLGVVEGTAQAPRVTYIRPVRGSRDVLDLLPEGLAAEEVFRFTAPCRGAGCPQFRDGACGVAKAAVAHLPALGDAGLPACGIRPNCRWYADEGVAACRRCPSVVTADKARVGTRYAEAIPYAPDRGRAVAVGAPGAIAASTS